MGHLFGDGAGDVGVPGVHIDRSCFWEYDEIHVVHGDRSEKDFVAENECPEESSAILERELIRTHVRQAVIGNCDNSLIENFEIQLECQIVRNAQMNGSSIGQSSGFNGQ